MSKIEWTEKTWNPIVGCTKISTGCKECYAEKFARRHAKNPLTKHKYESVIDKTTGLWNGVVNISEKEFSKPLKWKTPKMIFVCSMGDLFHESIPFGWIDRVFLTMLSQKQHIYQVLTKRPYRLKQYIDYRANLLDEGTWEIPPHIWVGVTAENQETANERIPILLGLPIQIKWVSCEPLLGEITLDWVDFCDDSINSLNKDLSDWPHCDNLSSLNWVVAGPETGPRRRKMEVRWIEALYLQCKKENIPFYDKKDILGLYLAQYPNSMLL